MYAIIDGATPSVLLIEKLYEVKPLISCNADAKVSCTKGVLITQYYPVLIISSPFRGGSCLTRLAARQLGLEIEFTQLWTFA
jgi:hypothetical protein